MYPSVGSAPRTPCFSCIEKPRTRHGTPDVASLGLKGQDQLPCPAASAHPIASQDTSGLLGPQGTLLAKGQLLVHQDSLGLLCRAASQRVGPHQVLVHGVQGFKPAEGDG